MKRTHKRIASRKPAENTTGKLPIVNKTAPSRRKIICNIEIISRVAPICVKRLKNIENSWGLFITTRAHKNSSQIIGIINRISKIAQMLADNPMIKNVKK